jgi:hypothetical protein
VLELDAAAYTGQPGMHTQGQEQYLQQPAPLRRIIPSCRTEPLNACLPGQVYLYCRESSSVQRLSVGSTSLKRATLDPRGAGGDVAKATSAMISMPVI